MIKEPGCEQFEVFQKRTTGSTLLALRSLMDGGPRSQGGRFYVAIAALVLLGAMVIGE
jgi:hypothetical protein